MSDRSPQNQDKFIVRLPDGLRARIKIVAEANRRSMNAEVVDVLEAAFPPLLSATESQIEAALRGTRDALYSSELSEDQKDYLWERMMKIIHDEGI